MEAAAAFGRLRPVVKTEKPATGDGEDDRDSPSKQHLVVKEDQLESARAEMGEVREENQRLKKSLNQIMKDYEALKMQFLGIVGQESKKVLEQDKLNKEQQQDDDQIELVSLTLGRFPVAEKKKATDEKSSLNNIIGGHDEEVVVKEALSLGLNCKFERQESLTAVVKETDSPNSFDHETKEEAGETTWPPNKGVKTMRSVDDDVTPQNPPKRARVCVRARCETATMNDGCQWRKYGQKIAKGNPCPRAYYRCTGSPTCPVRKQVQRCADDMSILITTYEGNHNHSLPASANAMASTTSAAASMLLSGSSTSATAAASSSTTTNNLHGLNFYSNNSKPNFYLSNNSSIVSSTSPTHPTITLDLTSNPSSTSSNSTTHFGKFTSNFPNSRYPFTSQLDFGSSRNNVLSWNNGLLSYNRNNNHPTTTTTTNNIYQNYIQQRNPTTSLPHQQPPLPDTIAAATKVITADPSFQSALAAALTSIIGTGAVNAGSIKSFSTRGEQPLFQLAATTTTNKGNGCGTSFLNNITTATTTTSNSPPTGNMVFVPSNSLPFSNSKSASASPGDHIDLTN
ncbi:WRKY transcription factor 72A-like isoform X2 [Benincasa hispida]|uniref:WRKY transcription factor 72A-like isoform X2 n=1 Tax=Benincasa hispida TaxID=102211 RepID=UPI0019013374|nr:WRKY transcription factor 72A-like isoform X2 [Benincasa hispida]